MLFLLVDLGVLRLEDAVRRAVARDWLPFDEGRVRERDFAVVPFRDREFRALVRPPFELRLALLFVFVCWAINATRPPVLVPGISGYPCGDRLSRKVHISCGQLARHPRTGGSPSAARQPPERPRQIQIGHRLLRFCFRVKAEAR